MSSTDAARSPLALSRSPFRRATPRSFDSPRALARARGMSRSLARARACSRGLWARARCTHSRAADAKRPEHPSRNAGVARGDRRARVDLGDGRTRAARGARGAAAVVVTRLSSSRSPPARARRRASVCALAPWSHPPTSDPARVARPPSSLARQVTDEHVAAGAECAIVGEPFEKGERATRLPCGHFFRREGLLHWLAEVRQRDMCRKTRVRQRHRRHASQPLSVTGATGCSIWRAEVRQCDERSVASIIGRLGVPTTQRHRRDGRLHPARRAQHVPCLPPRAPDRLAAGRRRARRPSSRRDGARANVAAADRSPAPRRLAGAFEPRVAPPSSILHTTGGASAGAAVIGQFGSIARMAASHKPGDGRRSGASRLQTTSLPWKVYAHAADNWSGMEVHVDLENERHGREFPSLFHCVYIVVE